MKDGRISNHESRSLEELQRVLGLSDNEMTKVGAKHAIERSLRRNRITPEQFTYVESAADLLPDDSLGLQLNSFNIDSGRLTKNHRMVLEQILIALDEEE
jgi:hypothetical protein